MLRNLSKFDQSNMIKVNSLTLSAKEDISNFDFIQKKIQIKKNTGCHEHDTIQQGDYNSQIHERQTSIAVCHIKTNS